MILIIVSLLEMRQDIQRCSTHIQGPNRVSMASTIHPFDVVIDGENKHIGIVECITNESYHVIFKDKLGHTSHGVFPRNQLKKVFIVTTD